MLEHLLSITGSSNPGFLVIRGAALSIALLFCGLVLAGCTPGDSSAPSGYRTDGTAKEQICRGFGIEKCDYEEVQVPEFIDVRDPNWSGIRSERKSATRTMCYMGLAWGVFTKRKLMFDCEPIYEPLPRADLAGSPELRDALMESFAIMAEASAMFRICATNTASTDESAAWSNHATEIGASAERIAMHLQATEFLLAFETQASKMIHSGQFQIETLDYTNNCDAESLREARVYVQQSAEIEAFYLSN
jgi:hypothetical protein